MIAKDESALMCDFAETYHVFDWRELRPSLAATLAVGLKDDSRIKMAISGDKVSHDTLLIASAVDRLSYLVWMQTEDGRHNRNKPRSIVERLTNRREDTAAFGTPEEYEAARKRIIGE